MSLLRSLADELAALVERAGPAVLHVRAVAAGREGLSNGSGVVVGLAGNPVSSPADLHHILGADAIGADIPLDVLRDGKRLTLAVRPSEFMPA